LHILCGGQKLTTTGNAGETIPVPQALTPLTVRFPEVAAAEKAPVMEAVLPEAVKPVPV
jgi:hypothetical protein